MKTMYELCNQRYDDDDDSFTHSFLILEPHHCSLKALMFRGRNTPFVNKILDIGYRFNGLTLKNIFQTCQIGFVTLWR